MACLACLSCLCSQVRYMNMVMYYVCPLVCRIDSLVYIIHLLDIHYLLSKDLVFS